MNFQVSSQGSLNADLLANEVGAFYGDGLEWAQLEAQVYKFWKPMWIQRERKRIHQTWFDYRHVHPALRSHYFMYQYVLAYRRAYKRFYDSNANVTNLWPWGKGRNLYAKTKTSIAQFINTMHVVDQMCMPYDIFFDAAFDHLMQKRSFSQRAKQWSKDHRNIPGAGLKLPPVQYMRDAQVLIDAMAYFERRNMTKLRLATHPHYRAENWAGLPGQREYVAWLHVQARFRGDDLPYALAALVYLRGAMHEREVLRQYGPDMVKQIRAIRAREFDTQH